MADLEEFIWGRALDLQPGDGSHFSHLAWPLSFILLLSFCRILKIIWRVWVSRSQESMSVSLMPSGILHLLRLNRLQMLSHSLMQSGTVSTACTTTAKGLYDYTLSIGSALTEKDMNAIVYCTHTWPWLQISLGINSPCLLSTVFALAGMN